MDLSQKPVISVIVTVHNAEKYLEECLESVTSQTFHNIEILCMDGGSTDQSPKILEKYAERDQRIHIIDDADTSYGHKINEGIRRASGQYISVLESDDMYCPDMLEQLYSIAEKYRCDYVNADYFNFYDLNGKRYRSVVKMYEDEDYGKLLECGKHPEKMRQILRYWTGIFRRDFLLQKEIRMNESPGASFQDMSFRFLTSALADTAYHLDAPVYLYRTDNPGSSVYDARKAVMIADEYDFLKAALLKRGIKDHDIWRSFYTWKYNDFYGNLIRFADNERKALYERCYQELETDQDALIESGSAECSRSIRDLLEKPKEEIWNDLDRVYDQNQIKEQRRKKLFTDLYGNEKARIIIFGCGMRGRGALDFFKSTGLNRIICCLTDNSEAAWNRKIDGYSILPPAEAMKKYPNAFYVIAIKNHENEICKQLQENGIKGSQIYTYL